MVSSKSKWEAFFKGAGIPSRQAVEYSIIFYDNRMRLDMLDEINKEVLRDLGIKAIGDVIAILRFGKQKHAEMNRSPSPEIVETSITGSSGIKSKSLNTTEKVKSLQKTAISKPLGIKPSVSNAAPGKMLAKTSSLFKITSFRKGNNSKSKQIPVNSNSKSINSSKDKLSKIGHTITKTTESIKSKPPSRLTLSQRFGEFETEAKRKKVESKDNTIQLSNAASQFIPTPRATQPQANPLLPSKLKSKGTMFTIQLPSKLPTTVSDAVKPKQKVTVVPALGKALNRNKNTSSIFDRLDAPSSSSTAISLVNKDELPSQKKNVFNRLGTREDTPSNNVQVVTGTVRDTGMAKSSKSVFNRLGDN